MDNLRPFVLKSVDLAGRDPRAWLAEQPEDVRAVTVVEPDGTLFQRPMVEPGACVDPTAQLIGGVIVRAGCYVGPYCVVRLDEKADAFPLVIGRNSNLQDFSVVHADAHHIGERVIVAHQAIVHGGNIEDDVTLYIQAVVDGGGTTIGKGSVLHQGSYVGKGIEVAPNRYVPPGQKVLTQDEADRLGPVPDPLKRLHDHVVEHNMAHTRRYLRQLKAH